jgi:multidrug resistance efflux pump
LLGFRYVLWKLFGVIVLGFVLFASLVPGEYRVTADAVIESSVRQVVVAPFASYVEETFVRAGDLVKQGDLLVSLDDKDISLERIKWLSRKQQVEKEYREAMAQHDRAKAGIISAERRQAEAQLMLLDAQLQRTRLTAPLDGMVVAGDLSQSLGSPVEQGQVLFEVAPLEEYRLVLAVDERDVGVIEQGQEGTAVLAALPDDRWFFSVDRVTPVSNAREGSNTFRVEAALEQAVPRLRPGMEGAGKIRVGERRLIWIWTHEMVNWLRLKFWTWWP